MKQLTKAFGLLTTVAFIATMVGCGANSNVPSSSSGAAAASGSATTAKEKLKKISIFSAKVEIHDPLEALTKKYTEETGNEVDVWGSAGANSYGTQLQAKLTANQGPSIFTAGSGSGADQLKSYYYDLSNEPFVKYIAPNMELKVDGKVVGVPYGVEGYGLVYNKDLVDPKNVTDLDSFTKTLEKLKADGKNPLSLSQEAHFLIGHILNTPFALQPDPKAFITKLNKGEVKMADTKEFQEFAKFMDVIKANSKNPMEVKYDSQIGDFATGKTAMIHQGNWSNTMLKDYKNIDSKLGMMPFPLAGNKKLAVDVAANWVINAKAGADEIKAAEAFMNWLFTSETGKNGIVKELKFIPAMTNIETKDMDPLSKAVFDATKSGQTIPWATSYFPTNINIANDLAPVAQEYFLKKDMTGQQLLEKLDAVWAKAAK